MTIHALALSDDANALLSALQVQAQDSDAYRAYRIAAVAIAATYQVRASDVLGLRGDGTLLVEVEETPT